MEALQGILIDDKYREVLSTKTVLLHKIISNQEEIKARRNNTCKNKVLRMQIRSQEGHYKLHVQENQIV